jgi:uracil-DNA glycosylase
MRYLDPETGDLLLGEAGKRLVRISQAEWKLALKVKEVRECPKCRKKEGRE